MRVHSRGMDSSLICTSTYIEAPGVVLNMRVAGIERKSESGEGERVLDREKERDGE